MAQREGTTHLFDLELLGFERNVEVFDTASQVEQLRSGLLALPRQISL
jgi:hypothetical protein